MTKIQTCPQCSSSNIHLYMGGALGVQYQCKTCGYTGPIIVEHEIEKKFKEKK